MDVATREWAGLVAYWLAGRTDALFPGPNKPAAGCDLARPGDTPEGCRREVN